MKIKLILLVGAALQVITACHDGTKTSTTNKDPAVPKETTKQDSAKVESGMMKPMEGMMAKIDTMQMIGDFDADFATMMVEHHQSAIDMAQMEVSKGTDEKIKSIAQNIISIQTHEQKTLKNIIKSYSSEKPKIDRTQSEHQLHDALINMMEKMKGMPVTGNTDKDFVMMMIQHHESAIEMAKSEITNGKNNKLKQMAHEGIADDTKQIAELRSWISAKR